MRFSVFLVLLVLLSDCYYATGFVYSSSRRGGGNQDDQLRDVSFQSNLSIISTGYFIGTSNFGGPNLTSNGNQKDVFLAKYDTSMTHIWSKSFGNSGPDQSDALYVDNNNNIFMSGSFQSKINFGGVNLTGCTATSCSSLFLVKFDDNGTFVWNQQYPMNAAYSTGQAPGLAVASDGSILLGGHFSPAITFGSTTYNFLGGSDVFLVMLDASGTPKWSTALQGASNEVLYGVALGTEGSSIAVATFTSSVTIQTASIPWNGSTDGIIMKFNSSGNLEWYHTISTAGDDRLTSTAVDSLGNIYAGGQCSDNYVIGSIAVTCNGGQSDLTLVKISSSGVPIWAFTYGNTGAERINDLAISLDNSVLITGFYTDSVSVGGAVLTNTSAFSSFIAKYSSNGTHLWSGKSSTADALRLLYDSTSGRLAIGASFTVNVTATGGPTLKSAGSADVYLAAFEEYAPSPSPSLPASSPSVAPHSNGALIDISLGLLILTVMISLQ